MEGDVTMATKKSPGKRKGVTASNKGAWPRGRKEAWLLPNKAGDRVRVEDVPDVVSEGQEFQEAMEDDDRVCCCGNDRSLSW